MKEDEKKFLKHNKEGEKRGEKHMGVGKQSPQR